MINNVSVLTVTIGVLEWYRYTDIGLWVHIWQTGQEMSDSTTSTVVLCIYVWHLGGFISLLCVVTYVYFSWSDNHRHYSWNHYPTIIIYINELFYLLYYAFDRKLMTGERERKMLIKRHAITVCRICIHVTWVPSCVSIKTDTVPDSNTCWLIPHLTLGHPDESSSWPALVFCGLFDFSTDLSCYNNW